MNIKLKARLSAYTKTESLASTTGTVDRSKIDSLFPDLPQSEVVQKSQIDNLFPEDVEQIETVSKSAIDSLFE